jgi:hypothetical protein
MRNEVNWRIEVFVRIGDPHGRERASVREISDAVRLGRLRPLTRVFPEDGVGEGLHADEVLRFSNQPDLTREEFLAKLRGAATSSAGAGTPASAIPPAPTPPLPVSISQRVQPPIPPPASADRAFSSASSARSRGSETAEPAAPENGSSRSGSSDKHPPDRGPWWMWVLMPIIAVLGGLIAAFVLGLFGWLSMQWAGYTKDGLWYQYWFPAAGHGCFGFVFTYLALAVSPWSQRTAAIVMVTILLTLYGGLVIFGLTLTSYPWTAIVKTGMSLLGLGLGCLAGFAYAKENVRGR